MNNWSCASHLYRSASELRPGRGLWRSMVDSWMQQKGSGVLGVKCALVQLQWAIEEYNRVPQQHHSVAMPIYTKTAANCGSRAPQCLAKVRTDTPPLWTSESLWEATAAAAVDVTSDSSGGDEVEGAAVAVRVLFLQSICWQLLAAHRCCGCC